MSLSEFNKDLHDYHKYSILRMGQGLEDFKKELVLKPNEKYVQLIHETLWKKINKRLAIHKLLFGQGGNEQ